MRLREGMFWRPEVPFRLPNATPPWPALSMTFRLRIIRPLLTSRGFTLRLRMRTVSEKGETCGRQGKPPGLEKLLAVGSERGRGRLDIRWQRWISFFNLWVAARELSFGEGATGEGKAVVISELCCELDEEVTPLLVLDEEVRDVDWREVEARLLVPTFCVWPLRKKL